MSNLTEILNTVVENNRVERNSDGSFNKESMQVEIEFECQDRELNESETAECVAFALSGQDVK